MPRIFLKLHAPSINTSSKYHHHAKYRSPIFSNQKSPTPMAATRLLRMYKPLGLISSNETLHSNHDVSFRSRAVMCLNKVGLSSDIYPERMAAAAVKAAATSSSACAVVSEPKTDKAVDLGHTYAYVADALSHYRKFIVERRSWGLHIQMFIEKAIIDCRFFTLLAIGGSLICSVLCFLEGCFLVASSYMQYFHAISHMSEQGKVVHLLMEAIDMFIMGTAMLVFATALHVMFVGQNSLTGKGSHHLKRLPSWMRRGSAVEAKSKIGHAVMLILQVQVLDKFKSIAVSNGADLACFAGALFLSSASVFVLARIAVPRSEIER